MIIKRWIFEFYFCSYAWMNLTCSRSFPRGVVSGGLHLLCWKSILRYVKDVSLIELTLMGELKGMGETCRVGS